MNDETWFTLLVIKNFLVLTKTTKKIGGKCMELTDPGSCPGHIITWLPGGHLLVMWPGVIRKWYKAAGHTHRTVPSCSCRLHFTSLRLSLFFSLLSTECPSNGILNTGDVFFVFFTSFLHRWRSRKSQRVTSQTEGNVKFLFPPLSGRWRCQAVTRVPETAPYTITYRTGRDSIMRDCSYSRQKFTNF